MYPVYGLPAAGTAVPVGAGTVLIGVETGVGTGVVVDPDLVDVVGP